MATISRWVSLQLIDEITIERLVFPPGNYIIQQVTEIFIDSSGHANWGDPSYFFTVPQHLISRKKEYDNTKSHTIDITKHHRKGYFVLNKNHQAENQIRPTVYWSDSRPASAKANLSQAPTSMRTPAPLSRSQHGQTGSTNSVDFKKRCQIISHIVSMYVSQNPVPASELENLIINIDENLFQTSLQHR